jgi:nitrogen fixation NifU-like protein
MMTDIVRGKTIAEVEALFDDFHKMCKGEDEGHVFKGPEADLDKLRVLAGVRQFPMRVKCATLAWHTLNEAVHGGERASTE